MRSLDRKLAIACFLLVSIFSNLQAQKVKTDSTDTFVFGYFPTEERVFMTLDIQNLKMINKDSNEFIKSVYPDNNLKFKVYLGKNYKNELKGYQIPQSVNTLYNYDTYGEAIRKYDSIKNLHENRIVFVNYKMKIDYDKIRNNRLTKQKSKFAY